MSSSDENKNTQSETKSGRKWDDKEYVRAYYRQYHRKRNGVKLHPYILDDGRRYRDVHEYPPEFESKDAWEAYKKERQRSYKRSEADVVYIPKPKKRCEACDVEVKHGKWDGHLNSINHKKMVEILEKHGVIVAV